MNFVLAFLIAGVVGAVGQVIFLVFKKNMVPAMIVLFALGGILGAVGVSDAINKICPGCLTGLLMNGGSMFQTSATMMPSGDWSLFVTIFAIIVVMSLLGVASALAARAGVAKRPSVEVAE